MLLLLQLNELLWLVLLLGVVVVCKKVLIYIYLYKYAANVIITKLAYKLPQKFHITLS